MLPIPNLAQSHHSLVDLNVRIFCGKFSSLAREEWRLDTETKYISEDISSCLLHNSQKNNNNNLLMFSHHTRKLLWDHYGMGKASCLGCNFHNMHIFKKQMLTPTELMLPCLFPEMVKKFCQKRIWPHRLLYIALWEVGAFLSREVTSDMCLQVCRLFFRFVFFVCLFVCSKKMKKGVL